MESHGVRVGCLVAFLRIAKWKAREEVLAFLQLLHHPLLRGIQAGKREVRGTQTMAAPMTTRKAQTGTDTNPMDS